MPFNNPIVAGENLVISGIRSEDFTEAESGWRIARDGNASFANLSARGDFGATGDINADSFHVGPGGLWLPDGTNLVDTLAVLADPPVGSLIATANQSVPHNTYTPVTFTANSTDMDSHGFHSETVNTSRVTPTIPGIYEVRGTTVYEFHTQISYFGSLIARNAVVLPPHARDAPTSTNNVSKSPAPASRLVKCNGTTDYFGLYTYQVSTDTAARRTNIGGTFASVLEWRYVRDANVSSTGGTPVADPDQDPIAVPKQYTKTYQPTWSRTYDGDNGTTFDDSAYCYQGYYSSDRGSTRSLVGYNYSQIQSDLSGATVNSVTLTFKVAHAYYNAGMGVQIGAHSYTSKPSTWSGGSVVERQTTYSDAKSGSSYTKTLPSSFGTNFKSGAWRGIAFGPTDDTSSKYYYGYLYGATQTGKPYLTIKYTK